jgi:hypothetical protein
MSTYNSAGTSAATDYDQKFRDIIANDPDVQAVIHRVWGNTPASARPSDTPKNLEHANDAASKKITQILARKGITLPDRTFVNPRTGSLEGNRGWAGLSNGAKLAIMAAAAATGVGAAGALGAFGGAAAGSAGGAAAGGTAAGTALPTLAATTGLPAALGAGGVGAVGATGGSMLGSILTNAAANAAITKAKGGSWSDALKSGAIGGAAGGAGVAAGHLGGLAANPAVNGAIKEGSGSLMSRLLSGNTLDAAGQGLGAVGGTMAHNRGVALDAMMTGDQVKIQNEAERRAAEADIMKKMQIAEYIKSGGAQNTPGVSVTGKPLGQFNFGTRPTTQTEKDMATTMEGQLTDRLNHPMQVSDYESKMNPGKAETALNWLSPILTTWGAANGAGKYQQPAPTQTSTGPVVNPLAPKPRLPQVPDMPVTPGLTTLPGQTYNF